MSDDGNPMKRLGDFEIIRELGRGGMGIVYEARQVSLNRKVALKVISGSLGLSSKAVLRFQREAEAAGKLHHTNIVPIYTTGEDAGTHYYAMELIEGPSLQQVIGSMREEPKRDLASASTVDPVSMELDSLTDLLRELPPWVAQTMSGGADGSSGSSTMLRSSDSSSSLQSGAGYFDTVARMIAEVADALDHAHEHGVIHRDIKPANLLLSPDGHLSVNDFGLARMLEQPGMTMSGEFVGSPLYMSPEQIAAGRVPIDHRTDIYSLGATLYELLTLGPPFFGRSRDQVIAQILHKDPEPPRRLNKRVPVDLETICLKAFEKDPDRRYQTAAQMAQDLRRYLGRYSISARRAGPFRRLAKFTLRHRVATCSFLAVVVTALLVGVLAWKYWPEPRWTRRNTRELTTDPGLTTDPSITRDGSWIAYASDRAGKDNLDIWIKTPDGDEKQLTFHPRDDHEPSFSPDGASIAFRSERDGGGIYVVAATGGSERPVVAAGRSPRFSPDGRFILYWVGFVGGDFLSDRRIFMVESTGGQPRQLATEFASARDPVWSPTGNHVVFFGTAAAVSGEFRSGLWVTSLQQEGAELLSPRRIAPQEWIPSPDRLVYAESQLGRSRLGLFSVSTRPCTAGEEQTWTRGTGNETHVSVARDGTCVFSTEQHVVALWSIPLDPQTGAVPPGARAVPVTVFPERIRHPSISDDGSAVVFASVRHAKGVIISKDVESGDETEIANFPAHYSIVFPLLNSDATRLALSLRDRHNPLFLHDVGKNGARIDTGLYVEFPSDWCDDDRTILCLGRQDGGVTVIQAIDLATRRVTTVLEHPERSLYHGHLAPDRRWICFNGISGNPQQSQVFVAPYRRGEASEPSEWISIGEGDLPRWSRRGDALYFVSERDGSRCLWQQRLNENKEPLGDAEELYHFHSARSSLLNVDMSDLGFCVGDDRIFITVGERKGNLGIATLVAE